MNKIPRPRARRNGFVLVLVLTMLALVTFTMAQLATQSLRRAQSAASAERSMRHRWRTLSIQRLALHHAPDLLRQLNQQSEIDGRGSHRAGEAESFVDFRVLVDSHQYRIRIADESAKLPVGALLASFEAGRVIEASRELLPSGFAFKPIDNDRAARGFYDFGQLLESRSGATETPLQVAVAAGERLSLWGPGRLGLQRARPETIDALWRVLFQRPAPSRLHELRQSQAGGNDWLSQLALRESELNLARQWMSTQSSQYSVWIIPDPLDAAPASFYVKWGDAARAQYRAIEY